MRRALWGALLAAAVAGQGDYQLVVPSTGEMMCAKSQETCILAKEAIFKGWLLEIPRGTRARCDPHPQCFSEQSNCIAGFNCPSERSGE